MKMHIIGSGGFIGLNLVKYFQQEHEIVSCFRNKIPCDVVIFAAGNSKKYLAEEKPNQCFEKSVMEMYHYLTSLNFKKFVLLSSIDAALINSTYSIHKRCAENLLIDTSRHRDFQFLIVRLPSVIGPGLKKGIVFDVMHKSELRVSPDSEIALVNVYDVGRKIDSLLKSSYNERVSLMPASTISASDIVSVCHPRGDVRIVGSEKQDYSKPEHYMNGFRLTVTEPSFQVLQEFVNHEEGSVKD